MAVFVQRFLIILFICAIKISDPTDPIAGIPVDIHASKIRNAFTTIFVVLNFATSWLGYHLLKHRAQHHLILQKKGKLKKAVPINHLVSCLSIGDFVSYVWQVRRIPGGRYGILMLWTAFFSLAHVS